MDMQTWKIGLSPFAKMSRRETKRHSYLVVVLMFVTGGCATTEKVAMQAGASISSIMVRQDVATPTEIYYLGPGLAGGMLFGAIGGAIVGANSASEATTLEGFAGQNNIDIGDIVHKAFSEKLESIGKFSVVENSTTEMILEVKRYGLSIPNGFSSKLVPVLFVQAKIINGDNEVLWRGGHNISLLGSPAKAVRLRQIKNNPALLRELWEVAANKAAEKTVSQISPES